MTLRRGWNWRSAVRLGGWTCQSTRSASLSMSAGGACWGVLGNAASALPVAERRKLGELLSIYGMAPDSGEMKQLCLDLIERKA